MKVRHVDCKLNRMKNYSSLIFITINLIIFGYVLMGFYDIGQIMFSSTILIGQNIAVIFAIVSYIYVGINLIKNRCCTGIVFALTLTSLIWGISLALYSSLFTFEMIKQLVLPFIMAFYLFYKNKNKISNKDILGEIALSSVFWISLTVLSFENIYNLMVSIIILGIAYYLIKLFSPVQKEVC